MSTERIRCKTEGCENTILPDTAARTDGHCMRCVGKRKQQERDEFVRNNRREVDRYAGLTDPIEIIREFHTWRKPDPLIIYKPTTKTVESLYAELTEEQRDRLVTVAATEKRAGNSRFAEAVATSMATLTDHDLTALAAVWIEAKEFYPAVLFRGANSTIRDHIIAFLESEDLDAHRTLPVNHALSALAWIGDDVVQRTFAEWEKSAPNWRKLLHVGPNEYAQTAGWELARWAKRDLVYDSCMAISPKTTEQASDPAVSTFTASKEKCPWCKRFLVTMLSVDATDRRFEFLGWRGCTLPILTCDACTVFAENIFAVVDSADKPCWHPANRQPTSLRADAAEWPASPWQGVTIELHSRGAMNAVGHTVGISASQIGGHPCWVQDSAYPKCPDCGETMMFIAQLDNSDFKYQEGVFYAFLCTECRVTATSYQQT